VQLITVPYLHLMWKHVYELRVPLFIDLNQYDCDVFFFIHLCCHTVCMF